MIWLASGSPRRRQLVTSLGLEVSVVASGVDEDGLEAETPEEYVIAAAAAKADAVAARVGDDDIVIGCDTVVVHDDVALGKPRDRDEAERVLTGLAGQRVAIVSGLRVRRGSRVVDRLAESWCWMAAADRARLTRYLDTEVWTDKAGSLAVQAEDPTIVDRVVGCYSNALGLAMCVLIEVLNEMAVTQIQPPPCHIEGSTPCSVRL